MRCQRVPWSLWVVLPLVLTGCGGSGVSSSNGGGGAGGGAAASVIVTLPPGADPSNAIIVTGHSESDVSSGTQAVTVNEESPTLATVIDQPSGKLLGMAILRSSGSAQQVNAKSTAVALIHLAMGMSNEQTARRTALLDQLEASGALTPLVDKLNAAWATDKFALENPPADLKDAIASVATAMAATVRSRSDLAGRDVTREASPTSRATGEEFQFEPFSGDMNFDVNVRQVSNSISPTTRYAFYNQVTRPATVYPYVVARGMNGNLSVELSAPEPKDGPIPVPFLPQFGGILDYARTRDIPVSMAENVTREYYDAVVLSGVFDQPEPMELNLPKWRPFAENYRAELRRLRQIALVRIFGDIVLDLTGAGGQPYTQEQLESTLPGLRAAGNEMSLALDYATEPTGGIATLGQMLGTLANSDETTRKVLAALRPIAGVNARYLDLANLSPRRVAALRAAARVFDVTGLLGPLSQYGTTLRDILTGNPFQIVRYSIRRGFVRLSPNTGDYVPGQRLTLNLVHPFTDPSYQARFWFKVVAGREVTLETIPGDQSGTEIETDRNTVFLRTTFRTDGFVRVTASVSYLEDGVRREAAADAVFSQTGTLEQYRRVYQNSPNQIEHIGFSVFRKEKLGRNRWKGGRYEVTKWNDGQFDRRHTISFPEFVGRPFGWGTNFTREATKLYDPEYGQLVIGYDLGDVIVIPVVVAFYDPLDPNYTDEVIGRASSTITEGLAKSIITMVERPE